MNTSEKKKPSQQLSAKILLLTGLLIMLLCFFLPYATASDNNREYLEEYSDSMFIDELEMTNEDAVNISLFEYFNIYKHALAINESELIAVICIILICASFGFTLLSLLFAVLKKPVAVIIFNVLNLVAFYANAWDHTDRGTIDNSSYDFGIGYYFYYIAAAIVFAGTIWTLVNKAKEKKQSITEKNEV